MKRLSFVAAALFACTAVCHATLPEAKRIVFLGDSITYGGTYISYTEAALIAKHPDRAFELLNLGLSSETVSGLSEDGHAGGKFPRPDLHERLDRILAQTKPNLVIACYGMNDGIYFPHSDDRFAAYQAGMLKLRAKTAAAGAPIIHLTPPVFDPLPIKSRTLPAGLEAYPGPFEGYNTVLDAYSDWLLAQAKKENWTVLDLHGPMNAALAEARQTDPGFTFAKDGIHPNDAGHLVMARPLLREWDLPVAADGTPDHPNGPAIYALIKQKQTLLRDAWLTQTGHKRPGVKPGLPLAEAQAKAAELDAEARRLARLKTTALPGKTSDWNGYIKHEFDVRGKLATVVTPKQAAPGKPWVWHGEFFGHKPAPDIALLSRGYHIVYLKVPDMLGSPEAMKHWDTLYTELTTRYGFAKKSALVGLSRGGLYCYQWAIAHPDRVACIYADAPVCDFKSWPGGKGKGKGDPKNWALVLKLWNFPDEAAALAWKGNPVDQLDELAARHIPLLHVFGDADDVVPWEENTKLIHERYTALGGPIELIRKPGIGHHPHGLDDPAPIIAFIQRHTRPTP
jgi:lysophospholipase L1-like esterase/pimeloyl-ACP methyl ester carboxylesterase